VGHGAEKVGKQKGSRPDLIVLMKKSEDRSKPGSDRWSLRQEIDVDEPGDTELMKGTAWRIVVDVRIQNSDEKESPLHLQLSVEQKIVIRKGKDESNKPETSGEAEPSEKKRFRTLPSSAASDVREVKPPNERERGGKVYETNPELNRPINPSKAASMRGQRS